MALDSNNILPPYRGKTRTEDPPVIHHDCNGSYAIRRGDWKLVFALTRKARTFKRELYNLKNDVKEATYL
ncbi:hypothetical protein RMSM_02702 [Rhodopirellula maiorica SM1]|uniref:Uncharacterized protein n=1 Tax=Rhodopirellula maiorica SM1 TaxID=1265738 RepID=M5RM26_9BACT|nr:hypothetical protein [Rhodopirellula maiorica]EMI20368.1 hypothetical protein RMSM_02702 [Rhodopirellula maiorica SM1]